MTPVNPDLPLTGTCAICSGTIDWKHGNTFDREFHYVDGCGQLCIRCYQTLYADGQTVGRDGTSSSFSLAISQA